VGENISIGNVVGKERVVGRRNKKDKDTCWKRKVELKGEELTIGKPVWNGKVGCRERK